MAKSKKNKLTFLALAQRVIMKAGKPLLHEEIWERAKEAGLVEKLKSTGKTPEASLAATLYRDAKRADSELMKVGSRPTKFFLKSMKGSIPDEELEKQADEEPEVSPQKKISAEIDLHPVLVWFADREFSAHCKTINASKSKKAGSKHNEWVHPDIVGFELTTQEWSTAVVGLAKSTGALAAKLYSFELKVSLEFSSLRESFFQAVSNSSWAHEGYLVAASIKDDPEFNAELGRLSQSFGIGVIELNLDQPLDSSIRFPARERTEIDWETLNRVNEINPDIQSFVEAVTNSTKINQPAITDFDSVLSDDDLQLHLEEHYK